MPGPSNKRKGKPKGKNSKRKSDTLPQQPLRSTPPPAPGSDDADSFERDEPFQPEWVWHTSNHSSPPSSPSPPFLRTPPPISFDLHDLKKELSQLPYIGVREDVSKAVEEVLLQDPFLYDPGNGPRVRDARAFMGSFFARPPALEDPLCAEFAQEEVYQMLSTVLPEETALIVWYNKSRLFSRICPACQRLYQVGDALPDLIDEERPSDKSLSPPLLQEQRISGLCSPVCFIVASFNYPGAIKSTWGCMEDEMDDDAWDLLNMPEECASTNEVSRILGMVVKMTRLHDLGLAQLCFDVEDASVLVS
ncbi:hypothetical protein CPB84DRAFT_1966704 [Gymnopilus junonius]|uniref:Uncharacterized protein n=1 Tax=Gymnopilus junonius TaxID=109634 RepID=A0A9P5THH5_GYMJU|nr:hypothetical protein CPB84DRAFT_1966704 [Gymnopilus junonius]